MAFPFGNIGERAMAAWSVITGASAVEIGGARHGEGTPKGARHGRRSALFEREVRHINSAVSQAGFTLRARARFVCRENAWARNMKRVWVDFAVGCGWTPSVQHDSPDLVKLIHQGFDDWTPTADFDAQVDFYGFGAMAAGEEFEAGESFIRMIVDPVDGLKLQGYRSEQLPYSNVSAGPLADGHKIRLGVEFDARGKRVAFHFYKADPGDGTLQGVTAGELVRIPAEEIIHYFTPEFFGQIRGYTRLAPALVPLFKAEEYEDALLERAAQSAKYIGFITRAAGTGEDPKTGDDDSPPDARQFDMEPGTVYELSTDEKYEESSPPDPGSDFDVFSRRNGAKACAAVGLPYLEVYQDVAGANFTSSRIGRAPFKKSCERWGYQTHVFRFCEPVRKAWLRWALLAGTLSLTRGASRDAKAYDRWQWLPPSWPDVNPIDDVKADGLKVAFGFKARSRVIEESGWNAEETDEAAARDAKRADRLGLVFASAGTPGSILNEAPNDQSEAGQAPADGAPAGGGGAKPAPKAAKKPKEPAKP